MLLVIKLLAILTVIKTCLAIILPCDFNFNIVNGFSLGYSCRVVNFTNSNSFAQITDVIGDHKDETGNNYRKRSNRSVVRVTMWNATIDYLPGNLMEWFPHLKVLLVKKCGMKSLTRGEELNGLRKIYFGFNDINRVPVNYFWRFCRLEILSLHGNNISDLPEMAFRDLISLKRLSLGSNVLKQLNPTLFDNCTSLEYIDLDKNFLTHIDGRLFSNLAQLSRIYLRSNLINSIDNNFLSGLPQLRFALFQNNSCIDESFPETPEPTQNPLTYIQSVFDSKCSPPPLITTTTPQPTTPAPRKKPTYQNQSHKIYFFENCKWQTPKGHRYF